MNISIKGRLIKSEDSWSIEIGILDYQIHCEKPLRCLKALETKLKTDLEDQTLKCFFKIEDSGVFYIITAQTPEMINFLAENLLDISDMRIDTNLVD